MTAVRFLLLLPSAATASSGTRADPLLVLSPAAIPGTAGKTRCPDYLLFFSNVRKVNAVSVPDKARGAGQQGVAR